MGRSKSQVKSKESRKKPRPRTEMAAVVANLDSDAEVEHVSEAQSVRNNRATKRPTQRELEVMPVGGLTSDEEDDIDGGDLEQNDDAYLTGAKVWGKKRSAYYSTDYVDKDYGGVSGSEEEAMDLEEEDAILHQKRLAENMDESLFSLGALPSPTSAEVENAEDEPAKDVEKISLDASKLTDAERWVVLEKRYPHLREYLEELETTEQQLPGFREMNEAVTASALPKEIKLLYKMRLTASLNLLMHLQFYVFMRLKQVQDTGHAVHGMVDKWRELRDDTHSKCSQLDEKVKELIQATAGQVETTDDLTAMAKRVLKKSKKGKPTEIDYDDEDSDSDDDLGDSRDLQDRDDLDLNDVADETAPSSSSVVPDVASSSSSDNEDDESGQQDVALKTRGSKKERRGITYEIAKNKGIMPKRRKDQRNPRVRYKKRHKKQLHRRRSQVPDVKRETQKYGGEARGIRIGLVKSRKLN